jgi:uncharacterized protein YjiS (DUF1127 family)
VRRIATIYAALDSSPEVKVDHLMAALAVWDYVYASSKIIFGGKVGDHISDTILDELRDVEDVGLTTSEIHELFSKNKKASQIRAALKRMSDEGWIFSRKEKGEGPGRPTIRWFISE